MRSRPGLLTMEASAPAASIHPIDLVGVVQWTGGPDEMVLRGG